MMMTRRIRQALIGVVLVLLPAFARADEAAHYSVKDVPIAAKAFPEQTRSMYIGEYGETFTYEMEWVLHPPVLKNGVEVVRFHSMLTNPPDKAPVKDSDFKAENFTPLNLIELVVMPKTPDSFKDLASLRAAKAEALTEKGVAFHIEPMGDAKWPDSTFAVFISSPYALYQRYAETKGQIFILTTGLKGMENGSLGYSAGSDFVGALGDFFYKSQTPSRPIERQNFGEVKRIALPLLIIGLILLAVPWGKTAFYPLGAAAVFASVLSSILKFGGFYVARSLDGIGRGALVSPGPLGWLAIPLFAAVIYLRLRRVSRARWWIVVVCGVMATAFLIVLSGAMHDEVLRGDDTIASTFGSYMFGVGLVYGACLGLTLSRSVRVGGAAALMLLFTVCLSSSASAQLGTTADRNEAIRRIDSDKYKAIFERMKATNELKETRDLNDYQCVELDGIVATNETSAKYRKYFDLHLQPAHNNDRKYLPHESSGEPKSLWQRAKDYVGAGRDWAKDGNQDLADLWDDKTGQMTERGTEILGPIADSNVRVNTIVTHSWGAVLLQNAIRTGLVPPPRRIIVVGLPDADLEKWQLLAHFTGTDVTVLANPEDLAVATAKLRDALKDMNVNGGDKRYNEGRIANDWQRWQGGNAEGNPLKLEGTFLKRSVPLGVADTFGHGRERYYEELVKHGDLSRTAAEMKQDQDSAFDERFQELREQDIEAETSNIYVARTAVEGGRDLAERRAMDERLMQGMVDNAARQERDRQLAEATLQGGLEIQRQRALQLAQEIRTLSATACKSPESISDLDIASVREIETTGDYSPEDRLSADMSGCEKGVFDRIVELARSRRLGNGLTTEFVRMLGGYYAAQNRPAPVYNPPSAPRREKQEKQERQKDPCRDNGNHYCP